MSNQGGLRKALPYLAAVALVLLSAVVRWALIPVIGGVSPFVSFIPAIALSAWLWGLGPGLLATALVGPTASYLFRDGALAFLVDRRNAVELFVILIVGATVSALSASRQAALNRYVSLNEDLEARVKARSSEAEERAREIERQAKVLANTAWKVAHELRTPLVSLSGWAVMLQEALDRNDTREARQAWERISKNVEALQELTEEKVITGEVIRRQKAGLDVGAQRVLEPGDQGPASSDKPPE